MGIVNMSFRTTNFKIYKDKVSNVSAILKQIEDGASAAPAGSIFVVNNEGDLITLQPGAQGQFLTVNTSTSSSLEWKTVIQPAAPVLDETSTVVTDPAPITVIDTTDASLAAFDVYLVRGRIVGKRVSPASPKIGVGYIIENLFIKEGSTLIQPENHIAEKFEVSADGSDSFLSMESFDAFFTLTNEQIVISVQQGFTGEEWDWKSEVSFIAV